jgi:WD40 repeat protein
VISTDGRTLVANTVEAAPTAEPAHSKPGREVATAPLPATGLIKVWDWASRKELKALRGCQYRILGLALSPDGRILASGGGLQGSAGEVKLWDLASGRLIADLKGHKTWVESVAFSPDGKILVSAGGWGTGPGEIKLWDLRALLPRDSVQTQ